METLRIVHLSHWSILDQLQLEEALLRADQGNWCVINQGTSPAVVMGISGKAEKLVHPECPLPLIRRFSGGGTVVVDENTLFFTLICNHKALPIDPYPEPILRWMAELYAPLFHEGFALTENDFTLHGRKFAGHAQYLSKDRWLHHTSLLYDYCEKLMGLLLIPEKQPKYRHNKPHDEFVCRLKDFVADGQLFLRNLEFQLGRHFTIDYVAEAEVVPILRRDHRKATVEVL